MKSIGQQPRKLIRIAHCPSHPSFFWFRDDHVIFTRIRNGAFLLGQPIGSLLSTVEENFGCFAGRKLKALKRKMAKAQEQEYDWLEGPSRDEIIDYLCEEIRWFFPLFYELTAKYKKGSTSDFTQSIPTEWGHTHISYKHFSLSSVKFKVRNRFGSVGWILRPPTLPNLPVKRDSDTFGNSAEIKPAGL